MLIILTMMTQLEIHQKDKSMRAEIKKAIAKCKETQVLNLQNMQISDSEITEVINLAKKNQPNIKIINLRSNNLGNKGAISLYDSIYDCHQLEQLNIEFNNLSHDGIFTITRLKLENQDLQLFFHGNQVTDVEQMQDIYSNLKTIR